VLSESRIAAGRTLCQSRDADSDNLSSGRLHKQWQNGTPIETHVGMAGFVGGQPHTHVIRERITGRWYTVQSSLSLRRLQ